MVLHTFYIHHTYGTESGFVFPKNLNPNPFTDPKNVAGLRSNRIRPISVVHALALNALVYIRGVRSLIFFHSYSEPVFQKLSPAPGVTPDSLKQNLSTIDPV